MHASIAVILSVIASCSSLYAQVKMTSIPERVKKFGYTTDAEKVRNEKLGINHLYTDTTSDLHYRISDSWQIIEVWKKDTLVEGQVINFIKTYVPYEKREKEEAKLISNRIPLSADTAQLIFNAFGLLDDIADMEQLRGWVSGLHGHTYAIESSSPTTFDLRCYWSPNAQSDSAAFKKDISDFVGLLYNRLNLYRHYTAFINNLPPGNYTDGYIHISVGKKTYTYRKRRKP